MMPVKHLSKINTFSIQVQGVRSNVTFVDYPAALKFHVKEFTSYVQEAQVQAVGLDIGEFVGYQGAGDILILYARSRGLVIHLHQQGINLHHVLKLLDGSRICYAKNSSIAACFDLQISGFGVDVRLLVGRAWRTNEPRKKTLGFIAESLKLPYKGVGSLKQIRLSSERPPDVILTEAQVTDVIGNAFLCYQIAHKILSSPTLPSFGVARNA